MKTRIIFWAAILALLFAIATPAMAQGMEGSMKPPLYTYVSQWSVPRAQWPEMEKEEAAGTANLDKLVADGTLVDYGFFTIAAHEPHGPTHGSWIQASSLGNLFKALDALKNTPAAATAPVYSTSEWHTDLINVSRMYNAHSGTFTNGILRVIEIDAKPGMGDDLSEAIEKYLVPIYEQALSDGTLHFYSIGSEWNHVSVPGRRYIVYGAASGDALDKLAAAVNAAFGKNPAITAALEQATVTDSRHDMTAYITSMKHK